MINEKLLKLTEEKCGSLWEDGASENLIKEVERKLNVLFPSSYINFLKRFGEGGITGSYIYGISDENFSSVLNETLLYREQYDMPNEWIVIAAGRSSWEEYLVCLDTKRIVNEECPVIKYDLIDKEVEEFKDNFDEYFNDDLEFLYHK